jgi:hypothetical protein
MGMNVEWTTPQWRVTARVNEFGEMSFDVRQLDSGADDQQLRQLVDLLGAALGFRPHESLVLERPIFGDDVPEPEPRAEMIEVPMHISPRPKRKYTRRKPVTKAKAPKAAKRTPTKGPRRKSPRRKAR